MQTRLALWKFHSAIKLMAIIEYYIDIYRYTNLTQLHRIHGIAIRLMQKVKLALASSKSKFSGWMKIILQNCNIVCAHNALGLSYSLGQKKRNI